MTESSGDDARTTYINRAENADVDAMIGVVHGDANFYKIAGDASTPEEKYRVGRNYLGGNMPRQAETLIRDAFVAGLNSTEVSYYYALALLSGRPFDHLSDSEFDQLADAFAVLERSEPDEWSTALGAVAELMHSLGVQADHPDADPEHFAAALNGYRRLPPERRAEVRRHLDMILSGGIQDRLEAQDASEVSQKRMGNGRRDRVWMFFEERPLPGRRLVPPEPVSESRDVALLAGGGALGLVCVCFGGRVMLGWSAFLCVLALMLWLAGAYLVARFGSQRRVLEARLQWTEARYSDLSAQPPSTTAGTPSYGTQNARQPLVRDDLPRLRAVIRVLVDLRFGEQKTRDRRDRERWLTDSAGIRATLTEELTRQYADVDPRRVGTIDWLVRHHAEKVFAEWKKGAMFHYREDLAVPPAVVRLHILGSWLVVLGLLVGIGNAVVGSGFLGFLVGAGCAAATALVGAGSASIDERTARDGYRSADAESRLREENKAFADWRSELESGPTDAEMAAWLDYDKAHIKALAMQHFGLANRDLIAHVVLTGPSVPCYGARVLYGPPRYSNYEVQLFLLTDDGLSQYTVQLHFLTGVIANAKRVNFRYNTISATEAQEVSVRVDGDKKEVVGDGAMAKKQARNAQNLVLAQQLTLTLDSSQSVSVLVGNFDLGLVEQMAEDPEKVFELARDTSGLTAAIRILEAIGREGRDWVARERQRRRRRILDYQRQRDARRALTAGAEAATPPLGLEVVPGRLLPSGSSCLDGEVVADAEDDGGDIVDPDDGRGAAER